MLFQLREKVLTNDTVNILNREIFDYAQKDSINGRSIINVVTYKTEKQVQTDKENITTDTY